MKRFNFLAVFLLIKVTTLPEYTVALTLVPFILHSVKLMSFVFSLVRLGGSGSYKTADIKDLHT